MPDELLDKYQDDYDPELELEAMELSNYEDEQSRKSDFNDDEIKNEDQNGRPDSAEKVYEKSLQWKD